MADLYSNVSCRMLLGDYRVYGSVGKLGKDGRLAVDADMDLGYP